VVEKGVKPLFGDTVELAMLLKNKIALVYGGGGAIGGAVARVFAREGAKVFLAGRTLAKLQKVAKDISDAVGSPTPPRLTRWTNKPSTGTPTPSRRRRAGSTLR